MKINILKLLKDERNLRVKITEKLRNKLLSCLYTSIEDLAKSLNIQKVSLRGKMTGREGFSFTFKELLFLTKKAKIGKREIESNIKYIKSSGNALWVKLSKNILLNEEIIEGIGYYVGDGRMKTDRGLSTVNTNIETIKFFLKWIMKYFNAEKNDIKIDIFLPTSNFNLDLEKNKWSKLIEEKINSVQTKRNYESWHKTIIQVYFYRKIAKIILDKLLPIIKEECLVNKSLAIAYLRGIMAAEGSVSDNKGVRVIRLKMKDKKEVGYVHKLLELIGLSPSFLFSKQDKEWVILVNGYDEIKIMHSVNIFKFHSERRKKLKKLLENYKRKQVKKGTVRDFYLSKLLEFEEKYKSSGTSISFANYIKRHESRVLTVIKKLQNEGLVTVSRRIKTGRPLMFTLTDQGKEYALN